MRTTVERSGYTITLDNGRYSRRYPKPAHFVEVPEWEGVNGQRLEIVPPIGVDDEFVAKALGTLAAEWEITLLDIRQVPPSDNLPEGATLLHVDPDRRAYKPVHVLLAYGMQAVNVFGTQTPEAGV